MRVNSTGANSVSNTQTESLKKTNDSAKAEQVKRAREAYVTPKADGANSSARTEISAQAKDFAKAHAVASQAPDIREDKVAELKRRIQEGRYEVDADKIAERMIGEHAAL